MNEQQLSTELSALADLKAFYNNYIKALNERDFEFVSSLLPDEVRVNDQLQKREDVIDGLKWLTDVVPDYFWQIEDLFVDEGRIAARLRDKGTPVKNFLGSEPNGTTITYTEFASYRVQGNQFAEMWYMLDLLAIQQQLGNRSEL